MHNEDGASGSLPVPSSERSVARCSPPDTGGAVHWRTRASSGNFTKCFTCRRSVLCGWQRRRRRMPRVERYATSWRGGSADDAARHCAEERHPPNSDAPPMKYECPLFMRHATCCFFPRICPPPSPVQRFRCSDVARRRGPPSRRSLFREYRHLPFFPQAEGAQKAGELR